MAHFKKWTYIKSSLLIQSLSVASFLILLTFPDVIFFSRSLNMVDNFISQSSTIPKKPFYPEARHRAGHHGFSDAGGAVWQSEPNSHFTRRSIENMESPYWNPYSATGSVGPETLVDQKFSPLTLLTALGGGSNIVFHVMTFGIYIFGIAFLFGALRKFLGFSFLSAVVASVVYLLNGYHIANLSSNVIQVYFYIPACLYALIAFGARPSTRGFLAIFLAHVPVLLTTFMPTLVMALISTYALAVAHFSALTYGPMKKRLRMSMFILGSQVSAACLALLFLAPLYLPIIDSFTNLGTLNMYAMRQFDPVLVGNIIGIFSPKHIFESYNAIDPTLWDPTSPAFIGHVAFHFGIIGVLLVAAGCMAHYKPHSIMKYVSRCISLLLIIALCRIYAVPGFTFFIEHIPFVGSVGSQYWWMLIAILMPVGAGLGMEALLTNRHRFMSSIVTIGILICALSLVAMTYTPPNYKWPYIILCLGVMATITGLALFCITSLKFSNTEKKQRVALCLIGLAFFEYNFYMNHLRFPRIERVLTPPSEVGFLREHIGTSRFANFGWAGLPPEFGSMYGLSQIESLNMNIIPYYASFFKRNFLSDPSIRWGIFPTLHNAKDNSDFNFDALNLLSVRYILMSPVLMAQRLASLDPVFFPRRFETPSVVILENLQAFPRAYLVPRLARSEASPGEKGLWARNIAFSEDDDFLQVAVNAGIEVHDLTSPEKESFSEVAEIPDSAVQLETLKNNVIKARVEINRPAVFVLSDAWYPGWRVSVNGKEAYLGRVNEAFRGVVVPAGVTHLTFYYQPRTLPLALALSISALFLLAIFARWRSKFNEFLNKTGSTITIAR